MYSSEKSIAALPIAVPSSIKHLTQSRAPNVIRESRILRPQTNSYATNGDNCIRFVLPRQNSDWRTSFLSFDVTITVTGGTYKRLCQLGGASMINRMRVFSNGFEETIEYYNRIINLIYQADVDGDVKATIGQDLLGYGTQADRNAEGAVVGSTVVVPVAFGIFNQGVLPLECLNKGGEWNVEFYLDNALYFVETDGTNPVVSITNIRWDYDYVYSLDGTYEARVAADVRSGRLQFGYGCYACFQNPVLNTINDIQIPWRGNALTKIENILVDQSTIANPAVNDKFITWPKTLSGGASVLEYQIQLKDGLWLPVEPIRCDQDAERAFITYLKSRGFWANDAVAQWRSPIDVGAFNDDSFIMVNNLNSIPQEAYARDYYFNNLSTMKQSQNTVFRLTLTAVPPAQTVLYSFVNYGTLLDVDSDGNVTRHV